MSQKVLIVEDDSNIAELLHLYLEKEGFETKVAKDGGKGVEYFRSFQPNLVLLDIMQPIMDGWTVLKKIREESAAPVIMLTAKGETEDKVTGLEGGADDYIVKPFAPPELLARVEGLLRHTGRRAATLQAFDAVIDPDNHIVTQNGTRVELTPREFDLLLALVRARGQLLYSEALYERVWGLDSNAGPRTVDIHIHRLRKKLHWDHKIVTVPKVGYKLLP